MRLYFAWTDASSKATQRQGHLRSRAVREAVEYLLNPEAEIALRQTGDDQGRIAIVHGWDEGGRAVGDAVRAAAVSHGWAVLDLPTVPDFGCLPLADDIRLVIAANASLIPIATRCAAFWGCCMLDAATAASDPLSFTTRAAPALAVAATGSLSDYVTSRWEITGSFSYHGQVGPQVAATAIGIEPSSDGILFDQVVDGRYDSAHLVRSSMAIHLDRATEGSIDGHPGVFPAGKYTFVPQARQFHRIVEADAGI